MSRLASFQPDSPRFLQVWIVLTIMFTVLGCAMAQESTGPKLLDRHEHVLANFEDDASIGKWRFEGSSAELGTQWASQGQRSLRVTFHPGVWQTATLHARDLDAWPNLEEFELFHVDVRNPTDREQPQLGDNGHKITLRLGDEYLTNDRMPRDPQQARSYKHNLHDRKQAATADSLQIWVWTRTAVTHC